MSVSSSLSRMEVLGVDIGGTGIKSAVVDIKTGNLLTEVRKTPTPQPSTPDNIFKEIDKSLKAFGWQGPIGCGFPAVVKKGTVYSAVNIDAEWIGYSGLEFLKKMTFQPVNFINDADAAALAEMKFGVGRPYCYSEGGMVLMITLGTGIGTGMFVGGVLAPNVELGRIKIGNIEAENYAATIIKESEELSWEKWGKRVNSYLQMLEELLSPNVIIIGGGVSESSEQFFQYLDIEATLIAAKMGNNAGIVGAALAVG